MSQDEPRSLDELPEVPTPGRTQRYAVVACPYCKADISRTCLGAAVMMQQGPVVTILHPLRCPECNHPLLPLPEVPGILPVHGRLT